MSEMRRHARAAVVREEQARLSVDDIVRYLLFLLDLYKVGDRLLHFYPLRLVGRDHQGVLEKGPRLAEQKVVFGR